MFPKIDRVKKPISYALLIFLILAIPALICLRPRAVALYHQVKGGMILTEVMQAYPDSSMNSLACDLQPLESDSARAGLQQAIAHLETARKYDPQLAQAHLLLGRAYCLAGESESALRSFSTFSQLRPENPLGHLEYGLACAFLNKKMSINWQAAGITPKQILAQAEQAFNRQDYFTAVNRYRLSAMGIDEFPVPEFMRWVIAAAISGQEIPDPAYQLLPVFPINASGGTKIEAGELRWLRDNAPGNLTYGDRLVDHAVNNGTTVGMWWSGEAAVIVQVPTAGRYRIAVLAQNTKAPPIQMELTINLEPVYTFEMQRGDLSWQEFTTEVTLSAGIQVLGLRFLNNEVVNDIDRDAVIAWIELQKQITP